MCRVDPHTIQFLLQLEVNAFNMMLAQIKLVPISGIVANYRARHALGHQIESQPVACHLSVWIRSIAATKSGLSVWRIWTVSLTAVLVIYFSPNPPSLISRNRGCMHRIGEVSGLYSNQVRGTWY